MEQELLNLQEHLSSPTVLVVFVLLDLLVLCVCFVGRFVLLTVLYFFLLTIMLSVLLRYTNSDYPFGIFKLFLYMFNVVLRVYVHIGLM